MNIASFGKQGRVETFLCTRTGGNPIRFWRVGTPEWFGIDGLRRHLLVTVTNPSASLKVGFIPCCTYLISGSVGKCINCSHTHIQMVWSLYSHMNSLNLLKSIACLEPDVVLVSLLFLTLSIHPSRKSAQAILNE